MTFELRDKLADIVNRIASEGDGYVLEQVKQEYVDEIFAAFGIEAEDADAERRSTRRA